jgi:hypothetical protein
MFYVLAAFKIHEKNNSDEGMSNNGKRKWVSFEVKVFVMRLKNNRLCDFNTIVNWGLVLFGCCLFQLKFRFVFVTVPNKFHQKINFSSSGYVANDFQNMCSFLPVTNTRQH